MKERGSRELLLLIISFCFIRSASLGADGGAISFLGLEAGVWRPYVWRFSTPPMLISADRYDIQAASLSSEATTIVYAGSDGTLGVIDVGTKARSLLGSRFLSGSYGHPTWLNKNDIAYSVYFVTPPTEDSDIYSYSLSQGKQRLLVKQTGSQDFPRASIDGTRLAYMSSVTTTVTGLGTQITQQLWMANLQTGKVEQLTVGGARDTKPAWSPDGKSIAFSSDRDGNPEIWVIEVETRKLTKLTKGKGQKTDPCWSPDGAQILYVTTATGKRGLELLDLKSGKTTALKPFGDKDVEIRDPAWGR